MRYTELFSPRMDTDNDFSFVHVCLLLCLPPVFAMLLVAFYFGYGPAISELMGLS